MSLQAVSDLSSHQELLESLHVQDFHRASQLLESCTFLPYSDHDNDKRKSEQVPASFVEDDQHSAPEHTSKDIVEEEYTKMAKAQCLEEAIRHLFFLIIDEHLTLPSGFVTLFFREIDLRYCIPTLRSSYSELTLYHSCVLHELCLEREFEAVQIILSALPVDVMKNELRRMDYLSIESNQGWTGGRDNNEMRQDPVGMTTEENVAVDLICTPLQALWETFLTIDDRCNFMNNADRLDLIKPPKDLDDIVADQDIKGIFCLSLLLLWLYDGRGTPPCTPPGADVNKTIRSPPQDHSFPGDDQNNHQNDSSCPPLLYFDRLIHVLADIGLYGHVGLLRMIARLYPRCLDVENDDGNLPIHVFASDSGIFYDRSRTDCAIIFDTIAVDNRNENDLKRAVADDSPVATKTTFLRLERTESEDYQHLKNIRGSHHVPPIIAILELYPHYASVPDKDGNLPIHLFLWSLKQKRESQENVFNLYVRNALQCEELMNQQSSSTLVTPSDQNSNRATGIDDGNSSSAEAGEIFFPYHQDLFFVLKALVAFDSNSLCCADVTHRLFPFMIASSNSSNAPLDYVFYLLCKNPTVATFHLAS